MTISEKIFGDERTTEHYSSFMKTEDGEISLEDRKKWFYEFYPNGEIAEEVLKVSEGPDGEIISGAVLLTKDGERHIVGKAIGYGEFKGEKPTPEEIRLAKDSAVESALRWAGFSLQSESFWEFADRVIAEDYNYQ